MLNLMDGFYRWIDGLFLQLKCGCLLASFLLKKSSFPLLISFTLLKNLRLKTILLFGAGKSATVLIDYLIAESRINNWKFIVADANKEQILLKTNNSKFAEAVQLDINDDHSRAKLIERAHVVISMMPPHLHFLVAKDCVEYRKHLLTASYLDNQIKSLQDEINHRKLLFLCEMGLDPGIDHMSAMQLLHKIKSGGGDVTSFRSHCGGLVAPESDDNPWHYKISWNPRNVVLAGKAGAVYKKDNETITESYQSLFETDRSIDTHDDSIGALSYYPNRDSLPYIDIYDLHKASTFVRTTLRYPQFMDGWKNIIELKLTDETPVFESDGKTLRDFFTDHFQKHGFEKWVAEKLDASFTESKTVLENLMRLMEAEAEAESAGEEVPANFMIVNDKGHLKDIDIHDIKNSAASSVAAKVYHANLILKQLIFLGLEDNETYINKGFCSAADVLQVALETKLALKPEDRDMVVMIHEIEYIKGGTKHSINSSLIVKGNDSHHTAMAKTVGLPLGIAAKLLLEDVITLRGLHIPVKEAIYAPVLAELQKHGVTFIEKEL